ncbi:MAG TPA: metallophosphoesterase family protein [Desulfuromonadales bacterium]|nr:metallophosphoesterase family protein [Desulfuromonadales bacterium]
MAKTTGTMKIGLISDVHASPGPLKKALTLLQQAQVEEILCAGDIAGYGNNLEGTVRLLAEHRCRAILGNHDLWHLQDRGAGNADPTDRYLQSLPLYLWFSVAGKSLFMVHASPPDSVMNGITLLDENGALLPERTALWRELLRPLACDLLVVGHTHQVFAERLGDLLVVNPGSTRFNHTCMVLHLPDLHVEILPLPDQQPILAWNWGMDRGGFSEPA